MGDGGRTGRSIVANYYPYAWGTAHAPETAGIVDVESPYALPRTFVERESREAIEAAIDRAIEAGTGMVLFGHNVVDGESVDPDGFETDVARLQHLTDYVRERGGEWVDSLDAVVRYAKTPVRISGGAEPVRIDDVVADSARVDDLAAETVRADRVARREVGVAARGSTDQPVPTGERTRVTLDGARFDHRDEFDPASGELVVSQAGTYSLRGVVHLRTAGGGRVSLQALCDGSVEAVSTEVAGTDGVHCRQVDAHLELDGGETVALAIDHGTGGDAHTVAGEGRVRLELVRLG